MNLQIKISLVWIALNLFCGDFSASAQTTPVDIQLNGIAAIFDDHMALFTIAPSEKFSLSEGESRSGVKLLAIDFSSRSVRIDDHGTVRIIGICGTPELSANPKTMVNGREANPDGTLKILNQVHSNLTSPTIQTNAATAIARAGFVGGGGIANASGSNASGLNNSPDKNAGSTSDDSNASGNPPVYQWWMQEAQKIENARMATADRVMAGQWQPYPLTPLTPSDTPAQLIGADSVFMDHGPGVVVSSSN